MATSYNQVSVSTTAVSLIASNTDRKGVFIQNGGTATAYIGGDNSVVSTVNNANGGYPTVPGEFFFTNDYTGDIYGITASGTTTLQVFEEEISH